ncbi:MAG TPA: hypothetical protein VG754_10215 [Verrucomicrobiae bacterium]|nr:hypothetical protein [Verrucomicrobiae bacterium]
MFVCRALLRLIEPRSVLTAERAAKAKQSISRMHPPVNGQQFRDEASLLNAQHGFVEKQGNPFFGHGLIGGLAAAQFGRAIGHADQAGIAEGGDQSLAARACRGQ